MRLTVAFLAFAAVLLLSGCAQKTAPQSCIGIPEAESDGCVRNAAVMEQNPYLCYSITDETAREECIRSSVSQEAKDRLEAEANARQRSARQAAPATQGQPPAESQPPPGNESGGSCQSKTGQEMENCILSGALASQNISECERLATKDGSDSCISQIAQKTKDVESCALLSSEESRSLCSLYAKGNE